MLETEKMADLMDDLGAEPANYLVTLQSMKRDDGFVLGGAGLAKDEI